MKSVLAKFKDPATVIVSAVVALVAVAIWQKIAAPRITAATGKDVSVV